MFVRLAVNVALLAAALSARPIEATPLLACECTRREPPCSAYWDASAVFVGRVEAISRTGGSRRVTFNVRQSFRGVSSSTVDVLTSPAGQRCSLSLRSGQEYLVYAHRSEGTSTLTTSVCAGTREVSDAASDLSYARSIQGTGTSDGNGGAAIGRVAGQVLLVPRTLAGAVVGLARPLADVSVVVSKDGLGEIATTSTNEAGDYSFESRGPGRYTIRVIAGDRYYSDEPAGIAELRDVRACAVVDRRLHNNGRITGRVKDAGGRPIAGLTIDLTTSIGAPTRRTTTDRNGNYDFLRVPPGRFIVGVNIGPRRKRSPRPLQLVYSSAESTAAKRVSVGAGDVVGLSDWILPAHLRFVPISGVVLDADGVPADRARVYMKGVEEDDEIVAEPAITDSSGRFVIAAVADAPYRLFAEGDRSEGEIHRIDSTDPVTLTATDRMSAVRLSLRRRY
jgi:Carboxypeptidase regulatory-like domain